VAHLYVEHSVIGMVGSHVGQSSMDLDMSGGVRGQEGHVVEEGTMNEADGVCDDEDMSGSDDYMESSEDEAAGIRLDDSEEERALGMDDGFLVEDDETPPIVGNAVVEKMKMMNVVGGEAGSSSFVVGGLDVGYVSEELGSSDPDVSDDDQGPRYEKFVMADLHKKYKFKVGLEFKSLAEFKEAIIEWNVLNGYEIKFPKNDKVRVRVVCKGNCEFLALVSQVGDKHTFRMKRWYGDHTCARKTENRSANSKWVSKAVFAKMSTSDKDPSLQSIVTDMRSTHAVGITMSRAWRAKKIAKEKLEGDAAKQYNLLWRYSSELRRVNGGNNCKISVERIGPQLQPRFSSFYFCLDGIKRGFSACRPFIGVDGCHLKTKYGGTLLIVAGRDPNDQYFPLAFGVCETETKESWRWFLTLLLHDIGQDKRWVFISDQQKVKKKSFNCYLLLYL